MFNEIKIECDASDEEIFDFKEIDKLTENKVKIFCKDNSFIKQEFNFNINECQHKYPKREILIKNKNKINIKNNNILEINENIINTNSNINKNVEEIKFKNQEDKIENIPNEEYKNDYIENENNNKDEIINKNNI